MDVIYYSENQNWLPLKKCLINSPGNELYSGVSNL